MKKISLFAVLYCFALSIAFAQELEKDRTLKNEVGLHIGGIGSLLMGGGLLSSQPLGVVYKRVNGNKAYRVSYQLFEGRQDFIPLTTKEAIGDNRFVSRMQFNNVYQHVFRVGRERRIAIKNDIQLLLGVDFQARYLHLRNFTQFYSYRLDSVSDQGLISQKSHYTEMENRRLNESVTRSWQYGVGLSCGLLLPVSKRWWLNANFRVDFFFGRMYNTEHNLDSGEKFKDDYLQFYLETGGAIISELTLFYCF